MTTRSGELPQEITDAVMAVGFDHDSQATVQRTPLHIDFQSSGMLVPPETLTAPEFYDLARFNAVGSANRNGDSSNDVLHMPVIDVDAGASVRSYNLGTKAVLGAAHRGSYGADSELRDVLGDNGIDLEVIPDYSLSSGGMFPDVRSRVGSIVLRAKRPQKFAALDSTQKGHSHLYIQRSFSAADHEVLLSELQKVGVISQKWLEMTVRYGASIVRTPWTEKDLSHIES